MGTEEVYTHAVWRVKPGEEEVFVAVWDEMSELFLSLPAPPLSGTLLRSQTENSVFYSFGPWRGAADVQAMRSDPRVQTLMERIRSHCTEATPGPCSVVREVKGR